MINMINSLGRVWCLFMVLLVLCSCAQRTGYAPVVELKWRAVNSNAKRHVVVRGETLYAIAFRYDQDYRQLAVANRLHSPYTLRVGQIVRLQPNRKSVRFAHPVRLRSPKYVRRTNHQIILPAPKQQYAGWLWPVRGRVVATFVPQQGKKGIDIAGSKGQKIQAAAGGVVAYAGSGLSGYGNLIIIKHNNQYLTAYGNNLRNLVKEGQHIRAGQTIAEMGVVDRRYWGVHFEIRKAGIPVNPLSYLKK